MNASCFHVNHIMAFRLSKHCTILPGISIYSLLGVAPIHQEFLQNKKLNLTMPKNFAQSYVKHFYTRYEYIGAKCQDNQSRIKPHCKCCQNVLLVLRVLNNIQNQIESTICCSFLGDQFLLDYVQKVGPENVAVILAV